MRSNFHPKLYKIQTNVGFQCLNSFWGENQKWREDSNASATSELKHLERNVWTNDEPQKQTNLVVSMFLFSYSKFGIFRSYFCRQSDLLSSHCTYFHRYAYIYLWVCANVFIYIYIYTQYVDSLRKQKNTAFLFWVKTQFTVKKIKIKK